MLPRFTLAHKFTLFGLALILSSGAAITSVTALQFRRELYDREYSGAFTVYLAAANYLAGHYLSKGERFVHNSLDYVLGEKFLRLSGAADHQIRHRPQALSIYGEDGQLVYAYQVEGGPELPGVLVPEDRQGSYHSRYNPQTRMLRVAGPLSEDGRVPGRVVMLFPSTLEQEVSALYRRSFAATLGVCVLALLVSLLFARRVLNPIAALTRAAQRVQEGDLDQQVRVRTQDEIGLLTTTFNGMMASLVRRMALMHRLQEWAVNISQQFDLKLLYVRLADMFEDLAQATFSRLYCQDGQHPGLDLVQARGVQEASPRTGMAQRAFESGLTQYQYADGSFGTEPRDAVEVAVPLVAGSRRIGAVHLGRRADGEPYDDETRTTLSTLAQQAAMALGNAMLYRELAEQARWQQEMKWAREIQQALLPRHAPALPGYAVQGYSMPAREVGGDCYDHLPTPSGAWYFMVGDVSGKGVPAALITSIVRSLLHTWADLASDPLDMVKRVNRSLTPDLDKDMFVTLAVVQVDPRTHQAEVVRAGHESILLMHKDGQIEPCRPGGAAMGLVDVDTFDASLKVQQVHLRPGDTLLLYTDGVTDAQDQSGMEFGLDRLETLLRQHRGAAVHDLIKALTNGIQDHVAGQAPYDDCTLLAVRRLDD